MFTDDDDDDDDFADHFSVDADVAALYYVYTRFVFVCFCSTKQKHKSAGKQKKNRHIPYPVPNRVPQQIKRVVWLPWKEEKKKLAHTENETRKMLHVRFVHFSSPMCTWTHLL